MIFWFYLCTLRVEDALVFKKIGAVLVIIFDDIRKPSGLYFEAECVFEYMIANAGSTLG